jgi:tetratricopeptide (TPR) repeat protein
MQEHRNLQSIKQKGRYRIMCLGESTTQGQYPSFLEEALNKRNIGVRFSVIDKGRAATNTPVILSQVESYLGEYHPDIVVTMMGVNDRGEQVPFEVAATSKSMPLYKSLRVYKLMKLIRLHILTKAKEMGFYKPSEDKLHFGKAQIYFSIIGPKEIYAESIPTEDTLKKAIELNPKNDSAYIELGRFYQERGKFSQAEDALKKAIELNPKNDIAYFELGWLYRVQGISPQAEDAFKKAIELNPKNVRASVELGLFYQVQGKFFQGEDVFKKAIELNPKSDYVYYELGFFYRVEGGKLPQAEDAFKKAIELNPYDVNSCVELGWLYRTQGKFTQVEDLLRKTIEFNSEDYKAYRAVSVLYEEIGKSGLAKEYAQKANKFRFGNYVSVTINSYRKLKEILDKNGIRLVCVQYPMRSVKQLKNIFEKDESVIFVDNESVFEEALKQSSGKEYFVDMFGGDFGHCTEKGNRLLAENIANVILKKVFNK